MKKVDLKQILDGIADDHGGVLNPEDVVEYARPKASPIHDKFTWDNTKAANEYRLWQARQLISLVIVYEKVEHKPIAIRHFHSLTTDRSESGGYRRIVEILSNKTHRQQLLQDAMSELNVFETKYRSLTELSDVFAAARKARKTFELLDSPISDEGKAGQDGCG